MRTPALVIVLLLTACGAPVPAPSPAPPAPTPRPPARIEPTPVSSAPAAAGSASAAAPPAEPGGATLAGGWDFSCALAAGQVYCWGSNYYGQLGNGALPTGSDSARSTRAVLVSRVAGAVAVAAGDLHACALDALGAVACWGRNDFGQLGDGTLVTRALPQLVVDLGPVVEISAGGYHTCARDGDGAVWCWGHNGYGALAREGPEANPRPLRIDGLDDAAELAAGGRSQCARRRSGRVTCWGDQSCGQLGDGVTGDHFTRQLVYVDSVTSALAVERTGFEGCVREQGGGVRCWGWNLRGGVGDGTTEERTRPVPVVGVSDAVALWHVGGGFCARSGDGGTRCWGGNEYGSLGDGTRTNRLTPQPAAAWADGEPMASAGIHGCARRARGVVECWGFNRDGQLGNGGLQTSPRPNAVLGLPASPPTLATAATPSFAVFIEQGGRRLKATAGVIVLGRSAFTIVLEFTGEAVVLVNASHDPTSYQLARGGARLDAIPGFQETALADQLLNPEELLSVVDTAPDYWFETSPSEHRFDAPCRPVSGKTECRRTVSSLYYRDRGKVALARSPARSLYLVLAAQREEDDASGLSTVFRQTLALRFR